MILTSTKYSIADLKDTGIYAGKDTFFRFNAKYDLAGSKPTTIIIDNASIHTSDEFDSHIEGWEKKDLKVYRLPTYSPELNIIEIVWRKIKYDWLPFDAYKSFADLKRELFDVLANIGISYNVDFS